MEASAAGGPKALGSSTFLDNNLLVNAFNGSKSSLAAVQSASNRNITARVMQEFLAGTPAERAARKAFLKSTDCPS